MVKLKLFLLAMAVFGIGASSCYRMPTDDDFCLVPATNNPAVTHEKSQGPIPQLSY